MSSKKRIQDTLAYMLSYPGWGFWAYALISIPIDVINDAQFPTAQLAYCRDTSKAVIQINKSFLDSISRKQLIFVLLHEIKHYIFMHPWQLKHRDPIEFNKAADRYINTSNLEAAAATETDILEPVPNLYYLQEGDTTSNITTLEIYERDFVESPSTEEEGSNGSQPGSAANENLLDSHEEWSGITGNISEEEAQTLIEEIVNSASMSGIHAPAEVTSLVSGFNRHKISWRRYLRSWIARTISSDRSSSWARLSRALPGRLPGRKRKFNSSIGFIMDTSASINNEDFKDFNQEAIYLSHCNPCYLLQVDSEIKTPCARYKGKKVLQNGITRIGYGSTNMNPAIEEMMINTKVNFVILFTDGLIPDIEESKICKPLLVVITRDGKMLKKSKTYNQVKIPSY